MVSLMNIRTFVAARCLSRATSCPVSVVLNVFFNMLNKKGSYPPLQIYRDNFSVPVFFLQGLKISVGVEVHRDHLLKIAIWGRGTNFAILACQNRVAGRALKVIQVGISFKLGANSIHWPVSLAKQNCEIQEGEACCSSSQRRPTLVGFNGFIGQAEVGTYRPVRELEVVVQRPRSCDPRPVAAVRPPITPTNDTGNHISIELKLGKFLVEFSLWCGQAASIWKIRKVVPTRTSKPRSADQGVANGLNRLNS
ncbi:hypothetical protein BDN72DRAFT_859280 [Pluteus cervinus]|uniref:Uncharacterized protein n=1 Tax=Pluteus cervinus TaxID=181527 RepID=A0ACD3APR1_9AGAR|nr:hypothetical protein BDN72DRAFT_859280 [Pluteus cervinus]